MKKCITAIVLIMSLLLTVGLTACGNTYKYDQMGSGVGVLAPNDAIIVNENGYENYKKAIDSAQAEYVKQLQNAGIAIGGDTYTGIIENGFVSSAETPDSYFSIDANTASYPKLRSLINNGYSIDKDAVRVEEMLNYFNYEYDTPDDGSILSLTSSVFDNPYNRETKLLTLGLAAQKVEVSNVRNNLVFLIDVSGSMFGEDRLGLVQNAFKLLTENLNDEDRISIVTYAGSERVALDGAYGYEKDKINAVITDLESGGSTAGGAGINSAYALAEKYFIANGNNRVILATDGDFNVGVSDVEGLKTLIGAKRETGVFFSAFGVGYGNYRAESMEAMALAGNGTYSYLDSIAEARRALVQQIGGTLITVAKDVKAGITFDPQYVDSYRLVGYENKLMSEEEFNDVKTDAGELGSGHTSTVVYELKLKDAALTDNAAGGTTLAGSLGKVIIRYKEPNAAENAESKELQLPIAADSYRMELNDNDKFVSAVVAFALVLRNSVYKGDANIQTVLSLLDGQDFADCEDRADFKETVKAYANAYPKE